MIYNVTINGGQISGRQAEHIDIVSGMGGSNANCITVIVSQMGCPAKFVLLISSKPTSSQSGCLIVTNRYKCAACLQPIQ